MKRYVRNAMPVAIAIALALVTAPALASEPGNMMKMTVTTHMQMPGMGAMGPMTRTMNTCTSAKKPDPAKMMQRQKDCKVTDYKEVGDTITYKMKCSGQVPMSGSGTFQMLTGGNIKGNMHIEGGSGENTMQMDMTFNGVRTGSCDYTPPKTPQ